MSTYTTARRNGNLYRVPARLTHLLEIERFVQSLVFPSVYDERGGVDRHLHRSRPIGVHVPILMVETLELQLEVGAPHQCLVHGRLQLEHVVADGQVVLQAEWR